MQPAPGFLGDVQPIAQANVPAYIPAPFVWAGGGRRMTPEEVAAERQEAQRLQLAGMDYSPVQSWTQGLDRVAQALVGGLEAKRARKADEANMAESRSVVDALANADPADPKAMQSTVLSALANPYIDDKTRSLVGAQYARMYQKPAEPHFFEANNGDQGAIDPLTGQVRIVYHDPTPKVNYITADNGDGTKQLIPVVNGVPMTGAPAGTPTGPVGKLTPIEGGPTPQASGGFP